MAQEVGERDIVLGTTPTPPSSAEFAGAVIVKRHYWLRDDFEHLMELLPAEIREHDSRTGASLSYPKTTEGACSELRLRGLDASVPALNYLMKQGTIVPERTGRNYRWHRTHIDQAAEHLNRHETWTSTTYFCRAANLRFGQCVKAFRVAIARFRLAFSLSFDPTGLVVVIGPGADPNEYSYIQFFPAGTRFQVTDAARGTP